MKNLKPDTWLRGYWMHGSEKIQYNEDGVATYLDYTWPDCSPQSCDVIFILDHKGRVTHCRKAYPGEYSVTMIAEAPSQAADMVNNPPHYNQPGQPEVWEQMVTLYGKEAYINFARLSAYKYRMRAGVKTADPAQDIAKARWYEQKIQELTTNQ